MIRQNQIEQNLNTVLAELGDFGTFQNIVYALLSFAILNSCVYSLSYIFTASPLEYRSLLLLLLLLLLNIFLFSILL